jgi:CheY-like chemotaxis protein
MQEVISHILQVAYYPSLLRTRTLMLETAGYRVTSTLGNSEAMELDASEIAKIDLVVVGFSASHSIRTEMVRWFKANYPKIPVVALQADAWEQFPDADVKTMADDPKVWIAAVTTTVDKTNNQNES